MRFISVRLLVTYALAGLSGVVLLYTSQSVQKAEDRLAAIEGSVESEAEALRVLKAEWAYLNSPARLEELAQDFLELEPSDPADVMDAPSYLPEFAPAPTPTPDVVSEVPEAPLLREVSAQSGEATVLPEVMQGEVSAPVKPRVKPAAPIRKSSQKQRSFDTLIDEIGGTP